MYERGTCVDIILHKVAYFVCNGQKDAHTAREQCLEFPQETTMMPLIYIFNNHFPVPVKSAQLSFLGVFFLIVVIKHL